MAQGQRLNPAARDAAVRRIAVITTGVVTLGLAGTVGLGVAIAAGIPEKDTSSDNAAYEEVVVEQAEPAPATVETDENGLEVVPAAPKQPATTATATAPATKETPVQKAPAQQQAPKPRVTTKAPQTQSGGS
jgi:hypothetical protein